MNDYISKWREKIMAVWQRMGRAQRLGIAMVAGTFVIALIIFGLVSQQVEYVTAFSGLSQQDAAAIVAKLKEMKTPYELADGGATVRVPTSQVYETRLQLASAGLPQGSGVGFELFDKSSFGMTDFAQKLNYQRALEGELSRTINQLNAVEQSRVHIVMPKAELYTEKEKPTTASVVLRLKTGATLEEPQIRGITNLLAGSIEGLKTSDVTIIDTSGNILSDSSTDTVTGLQTRASATQLDMQYAYQRNLEKSAQVLLEQVLGNSKAAVRVNAVLDWDQTESNTETYVPAGTTPQVRSSHEIKEQSGALSPSVGGIPGTSSNIPTYTTITNTTASQGDYQRVETVNNYELSKLVQHSVKAPGAVQRLSVAVLVDNVTDDTQIQQIEKVVAAAVGIDPERGDSITVASMPFDRTFSEEQTKAIEEQRSFSTYFDIAKIAAAILAFLVALFFIRRLSRSLKPRTLELAPAMAGKTTVTVTKPAQDGAKPVEALRQQREALALEQAALREEQEAMRKQREEIERQLSSLAKAQPAVVAGLVKTWMQNKQ